MKQKTWKNALLTLFLFILSLGIKTPVSRLLPEDTGCPSGEFSIENEAPSDENGISPLSDWDKTPTNIETFFF